jgi:hypothetical protein
MGCEFAGYEFAGCEFAISFPWPRIMRLIDDTHDALHQWNDVHHVKFQFTRRSASQAIDATHCTSQSRGIKKHRARRFARHFRALQL